MAANVDEPKYDAMSAELKDIIRAEDKDQVYIDCKGRFPADVEGVSFEYFPKNRAIPSLFFPFNGGNYQSPLVALKVKINLQIKIFLIYFYFVVKVTPVTRGTLLHIECRAWFEGVTHSGRDKDGLMQFEVLVR